MTRAAEPDATKRRTNGPLVATLLVVLVAMFGFGYALVPLYNAVCKVTGFNGTTERIGLKTAEASPIDANRWVTVEFLANTNHGMPWDFKPMQFKLRVHPGEIASVKYYVRNPSGDNIVGQAIPSVMPGAAAAHFKKIECFCFSHQDLKPGEARELPVRFLVDAGLPKDIHTVTLSYTFFNLGKAAARKYDRNTPVGSSAPRHDKSRAALPAAEILG